MNNPIDNSQPSPKPNESDVFEAWFYPGVLVYNQVLGKLSISAESLEFQDDTGQVVFSLLHDQINTIKANKASSGLQIKTDDKRYMVSLMDMSSAATKQQVFGVLSWGRKNGFYSAQAQEILANTVKSLEDKNYEVIEQKPRTTKQGILIMLAILAGFIVLCVLVYLIDPSIGSQQSH